MFELESGDAFSSALANAVLIGLLAVLPGLALGYARQSLAARRGRPDFSLRNLEAVEFDRAILLYERVCSRVRQIKGESPGGLWHAIFKSRSKFRQQRADELQELEADAHLLRATIIGLKRRPLERLRSWVHIASSRFSLGNGLAAHLACLAFFVFAFQVFKEPTNGDELSNSVRAWLAWDTSDGHILCANALAGGFALMATPLLYLARRAKLREEFAIEFCALKALAATDPAQLVDESPVNQAEQDPSQQINSLEASADDCFAVLGLSHSATINEVKEAYKTLIKQSHPDRVRDMSPVFSQLAEAESKKLNAAYREALQSTLPLESSPAVAPV